MKSLMDKRYKVLSVGKPYWHLNILWGCGLWEILPKIRLRHYVQVTVLDQFTGEHEEHGEFYSKHPRVGQLSPTTYL